MVQSLAANFMRFSLFIWSIYQISVNSCSDSRWKVDCEDDKSVLLYLERIGPILSFILRIQMI